MGRMIRADFSRISARTPRTVLMLIIVLLEACVLFFFGKTDAEHTMILNLFLAVIPFIFGLIELGFVYGDDIHAKMMQINIGNGTGRAQIVIGKWIEVAILLLFDFAALLVVSYGVGTLRHVAMIAVVKTLAKTAFYQWLQTLVYMSITMIFVFLFQTTGIATMVFILLSFGIINTAITYLAAIKQIQWLHIEQLTATYFLQQLPQQPLYAIGVVAYIIISMIITMMIYGSKELEF